MECVGLAEKNDSTSVQTDRDRTETTRHKVGWSTNKNSDDNNVIQTYREREREREREEERERERERERGRERGREGGRERGSAAREQASVAMLALAILAVVGNTRPLAQLPQRDQQFRL